MPARDVNFLNGDLEINRGNLVVLSPDETEVKALIRSLLTDPVSYELTVREGDTVATYDTNYGSRLRRYLGVNITDVLSLDLLEAINETAAINFRIRLTKIGVSLVPNSKTAKLEILYVSLGSEAQRLATIYVPSTARFYV